MFKNTKSISSRNLNKSNSDSPQLSVGRLDQIYEKQRRPSLFGKRGCPKGDKVRAKRTPIWLFAFFVLGISCLIGQTLVIRELIINFYGNELFSSLALGFWLLLVGVGSLFFSKLFQKTKPLIVVIISHVLIALFLPLEIFLIRFVKFFTLPGQVPNFLPSIGISFLILIPFCLVLGLFWTMASKIYCQLKNEFSLAITQAYFFETLGFVAAGIIFTFILVSLNEFISVYLIITLNLLSAFCLIFSAQQKSLFLKYLSIFCLIIFLLFSFFTLDKKIQNKTLSLKFKNQILIESINSKYGNISITQSTPLESSLHKSQSNPNLSLRHNNNFLTGSKKDSIQYNFFQNGLLIGSNQEKNFNEQIAHLSLLQSSAPKKVLIVGQGFNGLINEILKHPVEQIYYLELDPQLISLSKKYLSPTLIQALEDPRVKIIFQDIRYFLKKTQEKFDIVILNLPDPSSLLINRLYTKEFFEQIKNSLNQQGLISTYISSSPNYLSKESINFNASIYHALNQTFNQVLVLPLDINFFFASNQNLIIQSEKIIERFQERKITTNFITPQWLNYHLTNDRVAQINNLLPQNKTHANTDFYASAYLTNSLFWLKQFQPKIVEVLNNLKKLKPFYILLFLFLLLIIWRKKFSTKSLAFITAIPDFTLLGLEILFIFCFQIFYGYIYHYLALLIASIMLGIAIGNYWAWKKIKKTEIKIRSLIIIYSCLALLCLFVLIALKYSLSLWLIAPFLAGILIGLEFPLTNALFLKNQKQKEQKTGLIYSADLIGSCLGAILIPLFFIPFFGVYTTLFFLFGLNVLGVIALYYSSKTSAVKV